MQILDAKIITWKASHRTFWRHVILQADDGIVGVGEFSHDRIPHDIATKAEAAARTLIGKPASRESLSALRPMVNQGLAQASIYSALEQALTDIEARASAMPIWRLLGSDPVDPAPIALYANINRRTSDRSPDGFGRSALEAQAKGFQAIKIAPFDDLSPDLCGSEEGKDAIEAGLKRIERLREVLEPRTAIMVDCHWRFDEATALSIMGRLKEARVSWFECPLPETDESLSGICAVRAAANKNDMRLAGLETKAAWQGFSPFIEAGAYDVIMPDIKHAGGYEDIMDIAKRAEAFGVEVSLHNPSGPVAHVASVQATIGIGGALPLELQFDESPVFWTITEPAPADCNGQTMVPDGNGLGVKLIDPSNGS